MGGRRNAKINYYDTYSGCLYFNERFRNENLGHDGYFAKGFKVIEYKVFSKSSVYDFSRGSLCFLVLFTLRARTGVQQRCSVIKGFL